MTNVLLVRKDWEQNTCLSISNKMKTFSKVVETGEGFPEGCKVVFRWGCTANVPKDIKIINKAVAIHLAANKANFRKVIRQNSPNIIPITWFEEDGINLLDVVNHFPVVIRPFIHEKGEDFNVCNTIEEIVEARKKYEQVYISKFLEKSKEFRVAFIQNKVVFVAEKIPSDLDSPTWGLASKWKNYNWGDWPIDVVKTAYKANILSGLDVSAVDVIVDEEGHSFVCEVNSAPKLEDKYPELKFAMCFDYIVEKGDEPITTVEEPDNWKHFIHPALSEKAILN
jgi:glutathione synthase/RimK-type ligase-like ATP-grasp enzyme